MTTEPTDTGTDTPAAGRRVPRGTYAALLTPTVVVGAASFTETFHGLRDLMERVEEQATWLSTVGPIGIDGLQLVALAGTYFMRNAQVRIRLYMWSVFLAANAVSVAGNVVDASARHLSTPGVVIAGVWPVLLALAAHTVIVSARWLESRGAPVAAQPSPAPPVEQVDEDQDEREANRLTPSVPTEAQLRARARMRYARGVSCRQISDDLKSQGIDVSEKKVERWTADIRQARKAAPADTEPGARVNGVPASPWSTPIRNDDGTPATDPEGVPA